MHHRSALAWLTALLMVLAVINFGCGGGDGGGGDGQPGPAFGTGTLTGTVFAADAPTVIVPNAVVTVEGAGLTANGGSDGAFTINNVPAGDYTVTVATPESEDYGTARADVSVATNETTTVNFAVLPLGVEAPEQILLDPDSATVDLNGRIIYHSQVVGPNNRALEDLTPTWVVSGGIGTISRSGVFSAEAVGSGHVTAYAGTAETSGNVVVVAPRAPRITSFQLSPQSLRATGGDVFISVAVSDGDGVEVGDVTVQIFAPGDNIIDLTPQVTNPDTALACNDASNCYLEASYGVTYTVSANDNQPSPDGVQAPEEYSARVRVTDRDGMSTTSEFIDFTVEGIDPPPTRPDL